MIDIVGTWLDDGVDDSELRIQGYNFLRIDRDLVKCDVLIPKVNIKRIYLENFENILVWVAYKLNSTFQTEENIIRTEEKERERSAIGKLEKKFTIPQRSAISRNKATTELLEEANKQLEQALRQNGVTKANVAQGLTQAALNLLLEQNNLCDQLDNIKKSVDKENPICCIIFLKKVKQNDN
ncbi:hypothetical protein FQA39_LY09958 [Lamprigera yunnana]|nr:hypothetical protein FQA39_LY09958 [Lamprigera yunnana]